MLDEVGDRLLLQNAVECGVGAYKLGDDARLLVHRAGGPDDVPGRKGDVHWEAHGGHDDRGGRSELGGLRRSRAGIHPVHAALFRTGQCRQPARECSGRTQERWRNWHGGRQVAGGTSGITRRLRVEQCQPHQVLRGPVLARPLPQRENRPRLVGHSAPRLAVDVVRGVVPILGRHLYLLLAAQRSGTPVAILAVINRSRAPVDVQLYGVPPRGAGRLCHH
mmetsp:Transcript_69203/g.200803  ORF Transcript_69203/g.200803 Transcript_69203/m.200803 type:complete len:221 (-) Transcript_69203:756-1418(-)